MSAAPVIESTGPLAQPAAVVVSDDAWNHRVATQLLSAAGFTLDAVAIDRLGSRRSEDELVLLLLTSSPADRLCAIRTAVRCNPGAPLLATMPADAAGALLRRALRAGADGIVLDGELTAALVPTARALLAGQLVVPRRALRRQISPRALSHREKQILGLVVQGYTNAQIAHELFVAQSTVKTHLSSAFAKLDTSSRAEAAALILDPEEGQRLGIPVSPGSAGPTRQ